MAFCTVEQAIQDIKNGEILIVVDDEDRENEGDFVMAGEKATPVAINFMAKYGRGLICAPLSEKRANELHLEQMAANNTDPMGTAFTVSVDITTGGSGISALDRTNTILALVDDKTKPHELRRPGHIFPLRARNGGVLKRAGHTEAAVDLCTLAQLKPIGVICEVMNEDGTMARLPQLEKLATQHNLNILSIAQLIQYRLQRDNLIERTGMATIPTKFGDFRIYIYKNAIDNYEHVALTKEEWAEN